MLVEMHLAGLAIRAFIWHWQQKPGKALIEALQSSLTAKRFALAEPLILSCEETITEPLPMKYPGGSKPLLTVGHSRRTEQKQEFSFVASRRWKLRESCEGEPLPLEADISLLQIQSRQ